MILCDIGDKIQFLSGGKSREVYLNDLDNSETLDQIYTIQFSKPPKLDLLKNVVDLIDQDPRIKLRFYGDYSEQSINWTLLNRIQRLNINLWNTERLDEIAGLTKLRELSITKGVRSSVSLKVIQGLDKLETLYTSLSRDLHCIGDLKNLTFLCLREVKSEDLSFIINLPRLQELWISLGSYNNFAQLPSSLRRLSIHQLKGIADDALDNMTSNLAELEAIQLQNLKNVTTLDFLRNVRQLSYLEIDGLKNLQTLVPIGELKNIDVFKMSGSKVIDKSILPLSRVSHLQIGDAYSKESIAEFNNIFAGTSFWYRGKNLIGTFEPENLFIRPVK